MRRFFAVVAVLAFAGGLAGCLPGTGTTGADAPAPPAASAAASDPAFASQEIPQRPADAFTLTVASVWDGDTIRAVVETPTELIPTTEEIRIRLIGIDTPERSPDEECWAFEARDHLLDLLPEGSTVWASFDRDPLDRYDRYLMYLWNADGTFVNHALVAAGDAEPMSIEPNTLHAELFEVAAAEATASGAGQWGACG